MRVATEFFGHEFQQLFLHLDDILARGDAGAIGDAEDMGVHRDGRFAEGGIQDDVRGFPADTRQAFEVLAIRGTSPPNLSISSRQVAMMFFALVRYRPMLWM